MTNDPVPGMTVTWPWNPNHRYRIYTCSPEGVFRRLFAVRFSNKDQSIYLTPLCEGEFSFQSSPSGVIQGQYHPGLDVYISLHESGVVNVTTTDERKRVRERLDLVTDVRHVVTLQFNSLERFPEATLEEVNLPKGGHLNLPMMVIPDAPVMLTVVCAKEAAGWSPPRMGDTFMLHYKSMMKGKDYNVHFIQWQDTRMPKGMGDIGIRFGRSDDNF